MKGFICVKGYMFININIRQAKFTREIQISKGVFDQEPDTAQVKK
jgi:hypothetical protein